MVEDAFPLVRVLEARLHLLDIITRCLPGFAIDWEAIEVDGERTSIASAEHGW